MKFDAITTAVTNVFTFHYVSIKSLQQVTGKNPLMDDLHSTMYLLNRYSIFFINTVRNKFTFHYVSIKSATDISDMQFQSYIYIPLCIY